MSKPKVEGTMSPELATAMLEALASADWEASGADPSSVSGFGDSGTAVDMNVAKVDVEDFTGSITGSLANAVIFEEDSDGGTAFVNYGRTGVALSAQTEIDGEPSAFSVELAPAAAKEIAVAMFMAAVEHEARAAAEAEAEGEADE